MAVRLSVVMVHTPPLAAGASQLAEAIVGELIGMHEIDLTLVGNLINISDESTDLLSLESLSGDVAALDWQSPSNIVAALADLGFAGSRSPHTHDPHAPATAEAPAGTGVPADPFPARRIYAFDLNRFSDARSLCAALGDLKALRQVRTFTLSSTTPAVASSNSPLPPEAAATTPASAKTGQKPGSPRSPEELPATASGGALKVPPSTARTQTSTDLDQLLDQLDELDP